MSSRSTSPENDVFDLEIIPERTNKQAGTSSVDFDGLLPEPLLLHEDLKNGCGGQLWPAGMTLAKYMLTHCPDLRGKSILEIGAGGGLVGLAVAKGCKLDDKQRLLITDQIPMLSLMKQNITLNTLEKSVQAAIYDWGATLPAEVACWLESTRSKHPDVILAADCVYFEPAFPLLLQTLQVLIGEHSVCYFCFKKRRKADMRFIKDMKKAFTVTELDYQDKNINRRGNIFLYKLSR